MKKILPFLLVIGLLFSGTASYAGNITAPAANRTSAVAAVSGYGILSRIAQMQSAKNWLAGAKAQIEQVRANREKIAQLKSEATAAYKAAKNRIKQLGKNKDSLTDNQVQALKKAVAVLSKDKQQLGSNIGDIKAQNQKLAEARKNKDLKTYKQTLEKILTIQKTRIKALKSIISDINGIAEL